MPDKQNYEAVLATLISDSHTLRELAEESGLDPFSFYHAANLRDLDLVNQDLAGLNFERADLSGSMLSGITYEAGALNGAILDEKYQDKKDRYEFYLDDVLSADRFGLYFFARFRPQTLEYAIRSAIDHYESFAEIAGISVDTLRKARRDQTVSGETAVSICTALLDCWDLSDINEIRDPAAQVRQPFIQIVDLLPNGSFRHVSRDHFQQVFRENIVTELVEGPLAFEGGARNTFNIISWFFEHGTFFGD